MLNNFEDIQKQSQANIDLATKSIESLTKGFQEIAKEATDYSKTSFEKSTVAFEKVAACKSVDKAMEAQADFAKTSFEAFVAQGNKMGKLYADLAKEAYKPFENAVEKAVK